MSALTLVLLIIDLAFVVVCALKGKFVFAGVGVFIGIFSLVGAIRLAKPDSWWALNRYGDAQLERARARYPDRSVGVR